MYYGLRNGSLTVRNMTVKGLMALRKWALAG